MNWRVVALRVVPQFSMGKIAEAGCMGRSWTTPYRGPMAFVGEKQVLGVAELVDIVPIPGGSHLWKFKGFRHVGDIDCAPYPRDRVEGTDMPMCLNAWAQSLVNKVCPLEEPEPKAPEAVPLPPAPIVVWDPVEAVGIEGAGQLTMF
jgi:hypothetical protein